MEGKRQYLEGKKEILKLTNSIQKQKKKLQSDENKLLTHSSLKGFNTSSHFNLKDLINCKKTKSKKVKKALRRIRKSVFLKDKIFTKNEIELIFRKNKNQFKKVEDRKKNIRK